MNPRPSYGWPRGLKAADAAEYVGLGESTFLAEVERGKIPPPTWLTKNRKVWLREKLDDYLDRKDKGDVESWAKATERLRSNISGRRGRRVNDTHTTAAADR